MIHACRLVLLASCCLMTAGTGAAQENVPAPEPSALLRRLEEGEARIKALEETVRRQSERIAEDQRRLAALQQRTRALEQGAVPEKAVEMKKPPAVESPPEHSATTHPASFASNGLVQVWYASGNQGFRDTFRIRRTELYFSGGITKKARWQVMVDPAKALSLETTSASEGGVPALTGVAVSQASRILQNAVITLDYVPKVHVLLGQFKLPLSLEGQQSSGGLETIERALFLSDRARAGAYGDVRDVGMLVRGGLGTLVDLQAGVFNGVAESQNDVDRNDQKALAGSLAIRPLQGLQIGSSGAWATARGDRPRRDRLGADLLFRHGTLMLKAELMTGHDGAVARRGWYGHLGYQIAPKVEAVIRVDSWDPDRGSEATAASVTERDYVAGVNVFLSQDSLKLQANYLHKTFRGGLLPSRNVFLVNTQTSW